VFLTIDIAAFYKAQKAQNPWPQGQGF